MLISCEIEGVSPLLVHKFTDAAAMAATKGTRAAQVGEQKSPKEQAEDCLYISEKTGKPIIPGPNLFRAIIAAGKFFKNGKSKITTQKTSLVPSALAIVEIELPIIHKEPWMVDTRAVRIPSTGGRILRHRPCFTDWKLAFTLDLDEEIMSLGLTRELVDAAGKRIGLGDFRPDTKGPYGRFVVTKWKVDEKTRSAAA